MTSPAGDGRAAAERRQWVRLDNAANIFLAARNDVDTKVFRLAAELDEEIEPVVLQEALDRVYAQYPLFRAVLRRGVFWYYLQESGLRPLVAADTEPSVTHLYRYDSRELLFRVLHRGRRIALEVFHALTDGTGSLEFFQDLLTEYVGLRHPEEFEDERPAVSGGVKQEFAVDAFTHWFRANTAAVPFSEDATGALETISAQLPAESVPVSSKHVNAHGVGRRRAGKRSRDRRHHVVRMRGAKSPDLRTRVVELSMPLRPVLDLARAEGVSLTVYLIAVFLMSLNAVRRPRKGESTLTVSVPVNLRQFFPTDSGRNFFATTMLAHTFGDPEADTVSQISRDLDQQFRPLLSRESLGRRIRRLVSFEHHPALRVLPRPVKDRLLRLVNWYLNRGISVAMSNLGRVTLPDPVNRHVGPLYFHVSAIRPQFSAVSHGDHLTITFTSPFVETDYHATFVRYLTSHGVPVELNATRVTPEELGELTLPHPRSRR